MKKYNLQFVILLLLLCYKGLAFAGPQQKIVMVEGQKSYLMDGDKYHHSFNKPRGFSRDSVLPALLSSGWLVKGVYINEKSKEKNSYGYILLERY